MIASVCHNTIMDYVANEQFYNLVMYMLLVIDVVQLLSTVNLLLLQFSLSVLMLISV